MRTSLLGKNHSVGLTDLVENCRHVRLKGNVDLIAQVLKVEYKNMTFSMIFTLFTGSVHCASLLTFSKSADGSLSCI